MRECIICDSTDSEVPIIPYPSEVEFDGNTYETEAKHKDKHICIDCLSNHVYEGIDASKNRKFEGNTDAEWRTIHQVTSNPIFNNVRIGDDVAINQYDENDWWTGKVISIQTYSGRSTRFIERPVLEVELRDAEGRKSGGTRLFYEERVREILFKD